jgi:predicted membrane-bound dolichyl-phosphate-mannose-protein mannosyltransferase
MGLIVVAVLACYGAIRGALHGGRALLVSGPMLIALGVLAMLSVGCPIFVAGVMALVQGGVRNRPLRW